MRIGPWLLNPARPSVKIYRYKRKGKREGSFLYTISHYLNGKRERIHFTGLSKAKLEAQKIATGLANAETEVLQVDRSDWRLYALAVESLKESGVPIDVACREYAETRKILGNESLITVAKYYAGEMKQELVQRNVPELVQDFIQAKINAGVGKRGIEDYRSRLNRFAKAFKCPISAITKDQLQLFIDSLKVAGRTKRNFKASLVTFFHYARSKKCLHRDRSTEADHLDSVASAPSEIGIFTPKDFQKLISNAPEDIVPYLAIRAFAGIRDSEINRMEWINVKFEEGQIEVPAAAAKRTRAKKGRVLRRLVPIQPNLAKWLAPYLGRVGKICPYSNSEWASVKLAKKLKIKWVHNGLRHGFGSCRVAMTKNYPLVAYEMGNSVDVIKSCYDQVVTEKEATKWFSIEPDYPENIISIPVEQSA